MVEVTVRARGAIDLSTGVTRAEVIGVIAQMVWIFT